MSQVKSHPLQKREVVCKFWASGKCKFQADDCKFAHSEESTQHDQILSARRYALAIQKELIRKEERKLEQQEVKRLLIEEQKHQSERDAKEKVLLQRWALKTPIPVFYSLMYQNGIWTSDGWSFFSVHGSVSQPVSREKLLSTHPPRFGQSGWTCPEGFQGVIDFFTSRAKRLDEIKKMTPDELVNLLIGDRLKVLRENAEQLELQLHVDFATADMDMLIETYKSQCMSRLLQGELQEQVFQEKPDFKPLSYRCLAGGPN